MSASPSLAALTARSAVTLALGALAACSVSPPAAEPPVIRARFDPEAGVIPKPTDVLRDADAKQLAIPTDAEHLEGKTPAEVALIHALNTRDGWPSRMQAELSFSGPVRAASIDARSIRVFRVASDGITPLELTPKADPELAPTRVLVDPPSGGWARGGRYFIAALGGDRGLVGEHGEPVVADAAFWFLRVKEPLTAHLTAIPGATLEAQRENAEDLEELRLQLAPYFEHLEALGVPRHDVVSLWSFTITERPEVVMDKDAGQMPLPSDFLRDPASGKIDIPLRDDDSPLEQNVKVDLRGYDGFGLSPDLTFQLSAPIDPRTLSPGAVRVFALHPELTGAARVTEVPVTLRSELSDTAVAVTLSEGPLSPATDHVLVITDQLRDARGEVIDPMLPGVLAMLDAPLYADGASTIGSVDAESAARVEPVRQHLQAALALLDAGGAVPRGRITAAWPFRTMSIVEPMLRVRDASELLGLSPDPIELDERSTLRAVADFPLAALTMLRVARVYEGKILVPDFLDPVTRRRRPDGAFEPRTVGFTMTIPVSAREGEPLKVVIFGHGLTAERHFVLAIADALAGEGLAAIAIDFPYHGERTDCAWAGPLCIVNPLDQAGPQLCPDPCERGTMCSPDGRCVDNAGEGNRLSRWPLLGYPQASGGQFLNVDDMPAARDHFYQSVSDLSTLARSLRKGDWRRAIGYDVDPDLRYVGQSLGGIMGALFTATHPEVHRAVLNVPGADLIDLFRSSTMFKPQMDAFLMRQNITPGTERHERLINVARWLMDAVDPQSFAPFILHGSIEGGPPPTRTMLIQMATLDLVIPNDETRLLERLSGLPRRDYIAEHAFITIPLEPAYPFGVRDLARVLGQGVLP